MLNLFLDGTWKLALLFCIASINYAQVVSVSPQQNEQGVNRFSYIHVYLDKSIDTTLNDISRLFRIYGENSSLVRGITQYDDYLKDCTFIPELPFFAGERINVAFGPLVTSKDTIKAFHWRFNIGISSPTLAKFDSINVLPEESYFPFMIDYDHDGDIDLISGTGKLFINNGIGNLSSKITNNDFLGMGFYIDVNNDEILDIIAGYPLESSVSEVLLGDSSGNYSYHHTIYPNHGMYGYLGAAGDVNGDGFVDLMSVHFKIVNDIPLYQWHELLNSGDGTFYLADTSTFYFYNSCSDMELADMDSDGDLDFIIVDSWPYDFELPWDVFIFENDGNGNFNRYSNHLPIENGQVAIEDLGAGLYLDDFSGDELLDIALSGSVGGGLILIQDNEMNFEGNGDTSFGPPENFASFTAGDFNGDNRSDICYTNLQFDPSSDTAEVYMAVYINTPTRYFWEATESGGGFLLGRRGNIHWIGNPKTADIDNDGDLDIIHTGESLIVTYNGNGITELESSTHLPYDFELYQNYPNPFNPSTEIRFTLPVTSNVKLTIFNTTGEEIKSFESLSTSAGTHQFTWNGTNKNNEPVSSGIYIYRLQVVGHDGKVFEKNAKMILLR